MMRQGASLTHLSYSWTSSGVKHTLGCLCVFCNVGLHDYMFSCVCVCGADSRCILLPVVLRLLQAHMQEQRDLVMCARILTSMLSLIRKDDAAVTTVSTRRARSHCSPPPGSMGNVVRRKGISVRCEWLVEPS